MEFDRRDPTSPSFLQFITLCADTTFTETVSVGGAPVSIKFFWGDERVMDENGTTDPDDPDKWDYVSSLENISELGSVELFIDENIVDNTTYYYRAFVENVGGNLGD